MLFGTSLSKRAQSELAAHQKKILHVDDHVGISIAGLTADARLLWSAELHVQHHWGVLPRQLHDL